MKAGQIVCIALTCCVGIVLVSWVAAPIGSNASPKGAAAGGTRSVVNAADYARPESPTGGIQEAIDSLSNGGGLVTIPPGEYTLRQSIRVPAGLTLQGAGGSTILRRAKQTES